MDQRAHLAVQGIEEGPHTDLLEEVHRVVLPVEDYPGNHILQEHQGKEANREGRHMETLLVGVRKMMAVGNLHLGRKGVDLEEVRNVEADHHRRALVLPLSFQLFELSSLLCAAPLSRLYASLPLTSQTFPSQNPIHSSESNGLPLCW